MWSQAIVRRAVVLGVLFFWQGGFTFYAAVVVPVGQAVLSHREQGFVTRRVTNYLNLAGAVGLLVLAWDAARSRGTSARRRQVRWACWASLALTLGALAWLHLRLDALLDPEIFGILDRRTFRPWHRLYLWVSTVQWVCALVYAALALLAWREDDRLDLAPGAGSARASGLQAPGPAPAGSPQGEVSSP